MHTVLLWVILALIVAFISGWVGSANADGIPYLRSAQAFLRFHVLYRGESQALESLLGYASPGLSLVHSSQQLAVIGVAAIGVLKALRSWQVQ